jgi:hypothetical protein
MESECNKLQKDIAAFFLDDLDQRAQQALAAHLAACPRCRSEKESYARTFQELASAGDEPLPRHFFIYPQQPASNPWQLFRRMSPGWQTALASAVVLMLLFGTASLSRLQMRSDSSGWAISFGGGHLDTAAIKLEILDAARKEDEEAIAGWVRQVRGEISESHDRLTRQQQIQITEALARMDSQLTRRIKNSEGHVKDDTQMLVSDLYKIITQQRARDLEAINLRLDSTDANNAIKARQTTEILGTLLQVADLKLR